MAKSAAAAAALALLLTAVLTQCSWQNFEQREAYLYHPPSGKARFNPYYAGERLLTRLGLQTHSVRKLPEFNGVLSRQNEFNGVLSRQNTDKSLGPRDSLLLSTPGYSLGAARTAALLDWVRGGGALIFSPGPQPAAAIGAEDPLLNALGAAIDQDSFSGGSTRIDFTAAPALTVRFRGRIGLLDNSGQAVWQAGKGDIVQLLHYRLGAGAITVLSDLSLFTNRYLGEHDHADFLWALLHLDASPQAVWLQFAPQIPSLWALLWQTGWMLITALALLLIALIWAAGQRLGPLLVDAGQTQRSLLEHIRASAWFAWRHGAEAALLDAARRRVRAQWQAHHRQGRPRRAAKLDYDALARQTGLDKRRIIAAFASTSARRIGPQEFTQLIQTLQQIESKL